MKTSVNLQGPFSYALWPIIVVGALLLLCIGILIFPKLKSLFKPRKVPAPEKVIEIKNKFLAELSGIEADLVNNRISTRDAYKKMSACIRAFVFEVTGIEVLSYTLQDIQRLKMPLLEELIEEFYAPEFAVKSIGDSMASLQKTKRAIERWN